MYIGTIGTRNAKIWKTANTCKHVYLIRTWSRTLLWRLGSRWYILPTATGQFPRWKLMYSHLGQRIPTLILSFYCQHSWICLSMFLVIFLFCYLLVLMCFQHKAPVSAAVFCWGIMKISCSNTCWPRHSQFANLLVGQTSKSGDSRYACSCHRLCFH